MKKLTESMKGLFGIAAVVAVLCLSVSTSAMALVWSGTTTATSDGWSYSRNTTAYFDPNGLGTTITGSLDLTNLGVGTIMFGLIDKQNFDGGVSSGFMGGAYGYFDRMSNGSVRIGTSDGNANGEISGDHQNVGVNYIVNFSMYIHNNTIELTSDLFSGTKTLNYGVIKKLNNSSPYAWNEFQYGAYLGYDLFAGSGKNVLFNVSAAPEVSVPEPATMLLLGLGLVGLAGIRRKFKG